MSHSWIATFVCLLIATGYCSYIGDDDVVYQYLYRKPTPNEGLRRIRWVLLKTFTSVYGGFIVAAAVRQVLTLCCSITLSRDPTLLVAYACMLLVALLIGILQNGVRLLRGRPTRPLIDPIVWQRSFRRLEPKQ
jgi:hypothetical protein